MSCPLYLLSFVVDSIPGYKSDFRLQLTRVLLTGKGIITFLVLYFKHLHVIYLHNGYILDQSHKWKTLKTKNITLP